MERNYSRSTMNLVEDLFVGVRVETSVLAGATYLLDGPISTELFNVYGRIKVNQLFMEAITTLGNQACEIYFTFTQTTPAIGIQPINGTPVGGVPLLAAGLRLIYIGGAVANLGVITSFAGISDVICASPQILGTVGGVSTLGITTDQVSILSGTVQFVLCYSAMSEGAYCEARL
jgi:hypothetical protein